MTTNDIPSADMTTLVTLDGIGIDGIGKNCLIHFKQIYAVLSKPDSRYRSDISCADVLDELGRFKVWAGNIGALQPTEMTSSLEYRLRETARTRQYVLDCLEDLQGSLQESNLLVFDES